MTQKKHKKTVKAWTRQEWTTETGKASAKSSERYVAKKAIKALTPAQYAATTKKKKADTKKGKQHSAQPKKVASKTKQYRKV